MGSEAAARETLTREAVVAAARQLIIDKGVSEASLRQVGAALGVTAPALYAYVHDKRDLLRGVATYELEGLVARFAAVAEDDPVAYLRALSHVYIDYALENPELFKTIFLSPPELSMALPTGEESPVATRAFNFASDVIRRAIDDGVFRADLDPLIVSFTTWTVTHGLAEVLLLGFDFDERSRETLIDAVLDTMLRGLGA
jgi:AcrR family transcriptional regulator